MKVSVWAHLFVLCVVFELGAIGKLRRGSLEAGESVLLRARVFDNISLLRWRFCKYTGVLETMATAKEGWILVRLKRLGLQHTSAELGEHWLNMLWEQIMAVVPISIQLVLVLAIFFKGRTVE